MGVEAVGGVRGHGRQYGGWAGGEMERWEEGLCTHDKVRSLERRRIIFVLGQCFITDIVHTASHCTIDGHVGHCVGCCGTKMVVIVF
jgi:hypothetical protein